MPVEVRRLRPEEVARSDEQSLHLAWEGDRPIGCAGGWRRGSSTAVVVFAVYVTPAHRGGPVLDAVLGAVEGWARSLDGVVELRLEVHEANARARAAYERRGFTRTGATTAYPHDPPGGLELEMARRL